MTAALTCAEVRDIDAELALGTAPGDLREAAVRHLEGCPACRTDIEGLAATADALVHAIRPVDPPSGFESRVLARIAANTPPRVHQRQPARPRRPLAMLAAAAALILAASAGGGIVLGARLTHSPSTHIRTAALISLDRTGQPGLTVGAAYLSGALLVVSVDNIGYDGPCTVQVDLTDGARRVFSGLMLRSGSGTVGITLPVPATSVKAVTIADRHGYQMGTAVF